MKSVLVLLAHPALEKSRVNAAWYRAARGVEGVTVRDLYEEYPDFDVDPLTEQKLLLGHDVVVLQHPLYWYSTPALVKQWFDIVLEHGWAYGTNGNALEGKVFVQAISTGGREDTYCETGTHGVTLWDLLAPVRQTARLCKMRYMPPFLAAGVFAMDAQEIERSAHGYSALLRALVQDQVDLLTWASTQCIGPGFTLGEAKDRH